MATLDLDVSLTYLIFRGRYRVPEKVGGNKETISVVNCLKNVMIRIVSQNLHMNKVNQSKISARFCAQ